MKSSSQKELWKAVCRMSSNSKMPVNMIETFLLILHQFLRMLQRSFEQLETVSNNVFVYTNKSIRKLKISYLKLCASCKVKTTYIHYCLILLLLHWHLIELQYQLQDYVEKKDLLYKYQSGFRADFSTDLYFIGLNRFCFNRYG